MGTTVRIPYRERPRVEAPSRFDSGALDPLFNQFARLFIAFLDTMTDRTKGQFYTKSKRVVEKIQEEARKIKKDQQSKSETKIDNKTAEKLAKSMIDQFDKALMEYFQDMESSSSKSGGSGGPSYSVN